MKDKHEDVTKFDELKDTVDDENATKEEYKAYFDAEDHIEDVQSINCKEVGFSLPKMYSLKKKIFPQAGNIPSASTPDWKTLKLKVKG